MKRLLLIADMEGCIGVYDMADRDNSREKMIAEVDYLLHFFIIEHSYKVTVVDSHDCGMNVTALKEKYPDVSFICHVWNLPDIESYDAALMTGFHAQKGVLGWFSHTFRPEFERVELGNRIIGEIELNANLLAFYHVPVYCVAGDEGARAEVHNLCSDFIPTKCLGDAADDVISSYEEMALLLLESLEKGRKEMCRYSNEPVKVFLSKTDYLKCLPAMLFSKEEKCVVFENTIEFYQKVYGLCMFINAYNKLYYDALHRIRTVIKAEYTREEFDGIQSDLLRKLLHSDADNLSLDEIDMIRKVLGENSRKKNWQLMFGIRTSE